MIVPLLVPLLREEFHRLEMLAEMLEIPADELVSAMVDTVLKAHADEIEEFALRKVGSSVGTRREFEASA